MPKGQAQVFQIITLFLSTRHAQHVTFSRENGIQDPVTLSHTAVACRERIDAQHWRHRATTNTTPSWHYMQSKHRRLIEGVKRGMVDNQECLMWKRYRTGYWPFDYYC
ncbi:hypothetical protein VTI28DRAFT_1420 [Corynascus sepedonium]